MNKKTILPLLVLLLAAGAYWFWPQSLTSSEDQLASGKPIVGVRVPDLTGVAVDGERLFNANCASCHGPNAAGREGVAPPLVHKIYEPNHHGDQSFIMAAQRGVRAHHWPFGNMPPVAGASSEDVRKIVAYVRTLQRANGIN